MAERIKLDPAPLVEACAPMTLRAVARALNVDPAVLCRPLPWPRADRYAVRLGFHPVEVWGTDFYADQPTTTTTTKEHTP
jgi:lambda repressor-like predicted transcriptional regulator